MKEKKDKKKPEPVDPVEVLENQIEEANAFDEAIENYEDGE